MEWGKARLVIDAKLLSFAIEPGHTDPDHHDTGKSTAGKVDTLAEDTAENAEGGHISPLLQQLQQGRAAFLPQFEFLHPGGA